jgi:hypothetical protein
MTRWSSYLRTSVREQGKRSEYYERVKFQIKFCLQAPKHKVTNNCSWSWLGLTGEFFIIVRKLDCKIYWVANVLTMCIVACTCSLQGSSCKSVFPLLLMDFNEVILQINYLLYQVVPGTNYMMTHFQGVPFLTWLNWDLFMVSLKIYICAIGGLGW